MEGELLSAAQVIYSKNPFVLWTVQPQEVDVSGIHPTSNLDVVLLAGTIEQGYE